MNPCSSPKGTASGSAQKRVPLVIQQRKPPRVGVRLPYLEFAETYSPPFVKI